MGGLPPADRSQLTGPVGTKDQVGFHPTAADVVGAELESAVFRAAHADICLRIQCVRNLSIRAIATECRSTRPQISRCLSQHISTRLTFRVQLVSFSIEFFGPLLHVTSGLLLNRIEFLPSVIRPSRALAVVPTR